MNRKKWYWLGTMFCCLTSMSAQQTSELENVPAQVSIVYPLGTNGKQSPYNTYNFSLNLLTGKIGGLRGMEISGLYGQVERNLLGVQVAGLGNVVGGGMNGMQISGLASIIGAGAKGMQVAGITNIIGTGMTGIQVSGITNIVGDEMKGLQVSGIANIVGDEVKGLQVAGLANVGGEEMKGVQIAGIYNRTKTMKGLQLSILSVNDTVDNGVSLSLINIVKKGAYKEWELSFSDYANVALSFKMGTQKFYTLYTAGVNFVEDDLWFLGIGFGNRTPIGKRFDFQPELVFNNYFPINFKDIQETSTTRLKLGFAYRVNEKFGLSLAPNVYVMNADKNSKPDSDFYKISPFNALYTHKSDNRLTAIGIGVSVGLSMR